jgi:hypothetical protein
MPLISALIIPNRLTGLNPCCCSTSILTQTRISLPIVQTQKGFETNGNVRIRGIDYYVSASLLSGADYLVGFASFKKIRGNKTIENQLSQQTTAYPALPFYNEWLGLKVPGLGDYASIIIANDAVIAPGTAVNKKVSVSLEVLLFKTQNNELLKTQSVDISLIGNDADGWLYNDKTSINLVLDDVFDPIIYEFILSNIGIYVKPGSAQCGGRIQITRSQNGIFSNPYSTDFTSAATSSDYNTKFPWLNAWNVVDTEFPTLSILKLDSLVLQLPPEYRIIVSLKASGV